VVATPKSRALERCGWAGGILFVVALLTEIVISVGVPLSQDSSAAKFATELAKHRERLVVGAGISILYAVGFAVYLTRLHDLLRRASTQPRFLSSWVLAGGVLFVTLHGVSDIGVIGLLGGKVANYAAHDDPGLAYTLYLLTFALDSVGDVFASLFTLATGVLVLSTGVLPRWLGWTSILITPFFFLQGFGLGGVIGTFGLVLDLIGFLLFFIFVLVSSAILLRRGDPVPA
jgi:hypothetical protein